ncbi:NIF3-like protein 1 isoform X1 [Sphaerodactylus townsendi]|uniref:NIF3-like protein 1 isoform X1 n=1 Tax=Sphaerodactylus townsendi TaxID=933632 RepID=UPI002026E70C|nr:NIF3-like protein 1 isoform X1 [Sphaerodactylus townsendi]
MATRKRRRLMAGNPSTGLQMASSTPQGHHDAGPPNSEGAREAPVATPSTLQVVPANPVGLLAIHASAGTAVWEDGAQTLPAFLRQATGWQDICMTELTAFVRRLVREELRKADLSAPLSGGSADAVQRFSPSRFSPSRESPKHGDGQTTSHRNPVTQRPPEATRRAPARSAIARARGVERPSSQAEDEGGRGGFSTDEEPLVEKRPQSTRLFNSKDFQYLLSRAVFALELNEPPNPRVGRSRGEGKLFPRTTSSVRSVPFPEYFYRLLMKEWAEPGSKKQFPKITEKLYSLTPHVMELLRVPLVDAAVIALHSTNLIVQDELGSLKDGLDDRADVALRKSHKAMAMTIRAASTAAIISRAALLWARQLDQLLADSSPRVKKEVRLILKAVSFLSDASLDSMVFTARSMANASVARRALWLRAWEMDLHSKSTVIAYPFQGGRLFGDSLDEILVETRERKKAMPTFSQTFRSHHVLPRARQDRRQSHWSSQRNSHLDRASQFQSYRSDRPGWLATQGRP